MLYGRNDGSSDDAIKARRNTFASPMQTSMLSNCLPEKSTKPTLYFLQVTKKLNIPLTAIDANMLAQTYFPPVCQWIAIFSFSRPLYLMFSFQVGTVSKYPDSSQVKASPCSVPVLSV